MLALLALLALLTLGRAGSIAFGADLRSPAATCWLHDLIKRQDKEKGPGGSRLQVLHS